MNKWVKFWTPEYDAEVKRQFEEWLPRAIEQFKGHREWFIQDPSIQAWMKFAWEIVKQRREKKQRIAQKIWELRSSTSQLAVEIVSFGWIEAMSDLVEKEDISIKEAENMILAALPSFEFEERASKLLWFTAEDIPGMILVMRKQYIASVLGEEEITQCAEKMLYNYGKEDSVVALIKKSRMVWRDIIDRFNRKSKIREMKFSA